MVLISREWLALVAASMVALSSVVAAAPEPHDHNSQHHHRHDRKMRGALDNDAIAPAKDSSSSSSSAKEHGSLKDRLRWGKAAAGMRASHGGHFAPSPPPALADAPLAAASTAADCDKDYHPSVMSLLTSPTAKAGDLIPNQVPPA
ncbi:hypothetical protein DFJ73DRAFT_48956 [Zopfochytrium polystomum]|nr:hypothetical protein DFJ73DRAFT_48956 [Zopfochytrium polystomum]